MSVHVFVGPSLRIREARAALPGAVFHPPAAMGDVYSAVMADAEGIGLIDGLFETVPSVWHKEVLFALSRGVRVVGGASMGALRAAETHVFGTEGVGQIFEWYRDAILEDDDEVAVAHGTPSDGFRPLSDAMVNLRWGLGLARDQRLISPATYDRLIVAGKARYYRERSWSALLHDGAALGLPKDELDRVRRFVARAKPDLKRKDALSVLRQLARKPLRSMNRSKNNPRKSSPVTRVAGVEGFDFEPTEHWHKLVDAERIVALPTRRREPRATLHPSDGIRLQQVLYHTMLTAPDRDELRARALDLALRSAELDRRRPSLDPKAVAKALQGTATANRLMSAQDRQRIAELQLAPAALIPQLEGRFSRYLQLTLASSGKLSGALKEIAQKQAFLRARGTAEPVVADTGLTARALVRWYEQRFGRVRGGVAEHAVSLGFASEDHFMGELGAEYLFDRDVRRRRVPPRRHRTAMPARRR